jgi:hypothetical protein
VQDILASHNLVAVEKRKCWRHVTDLGAASGRSNDTNGWIRGIAAVSDNYIVYNTADAALIVLSRSTPKL